MSKKNKIWTSEMGKKLKQMRFHREIKKSILNQLKQETRIV